jgi:hypothetical protein
MCFRLSLWNMHNAHSQARARGLCVDHPEDCLASAALQPATRRSVAGPYSSHIFFLSRCRVSLCSDACCLSLSLTTVRRFPQICSTRPFLPWALCVTHSNACYTHNLAGHQKDRFSLGNGTNSTFASAVCRGRGSQPRPSEKYDPRQWWPPNGGQYWNIHIYLVH